MAILTPAQLQQKAAALRAAVGKIADDFNNGMPPLELVTRVGEARTELEDLGLSDSLLAERLTHFETLIMEAARPKEAPPLPPGQNPFTLEDNLSDSRPAAPAKAVTGVTKEYDVTRENVAAYEEWLKATREAISDPATPVEERSRLETQAQELNSAISAYRYPPLNSPPLERRLALLSAHQKMSAIYNSYERNPKIFREKTEKALEGLRSLGITVAHRPESAENDGRSLLPAATVKTLEHFARIYNSPLDARAFNRVAIEDRQMAENEISEEKLLEDITFLYSECLDTSEAFADLDRSKNEANARSYSDHKPNREKFEDEDDRAKRVVRETKVNAQWKKDYDDPNDSKKIETGKVNFGTREKESREEKEVLTEQYFSSEEDREARKRSYRAGADVDISTKKEFPDKSILKKTTPEQAKSDDAGAKQSKKLSLSEIFRRMQTAAKTQEKPDAGFGLPLWASIIVAVVRAGRSIGQAIDAFRASRARERDRQNGKEDFDAEFAQKLSSGSQFDHWLNQRANPVTTAPAKRDFVSDNQDPVGLVDKLNQTYSDLEGKMKSAGKLKKEHTSALLELAQGVAQARLLLAEAHETGKISTGVYQRADGTAKGVAVGIQKKASDYLDTKEERAAKSKLAAAAQSAQRKAHQLQGTTTKPEDVAAVEKAAQDAAHMTPRIRG